MVTPVEQQISPGQTILSLPVLGDAYPRLVLDSDGVTLLVGNGTIPPAVQISGTGGGIIGTMLTENLVTEKWSAFPAAGGVDNTERVVGLQGGINVKFQPAYLGTSIPLPPSGVGSAGSATTAMKSDAFPPATFLPPVTLSTSLTPTPITMTLEERMVDVIQAASADGITSGFMLAHKIALPASTLISTVTMAVSALPSVWTHGFHFVLSVTGVLLGISADDTTGPTVANHPYPLNLATPFTTGNLPVQGYVGYCYNATTMPSLLAHLGESHAWNGANYGTPMITAVGSGITTPASAGTGPFSIGTGGPGTKVPWMWLS